MSKIFLAFFLFTASLYANITWESQYHFILKKDEIGRILFYEKGKKREKFSFEFIFRWTLNDGEKVVVLSKYREFPRQNILYFKRNLRSFRQYLLQNPYRNTKKNTYLLLSMDKYDKDTKQIGFYIYIKDQDERLDIKYIDPRKAN